MCFSIVNAKRSHKSKDLDAAQNGNTLASRRLASQFVKRPNAAALEIYPNSGYPRLDQSQPSLLGERLRVPRGLVAPFVRFTITRTVSGGASCTSSRNRTFRILNIISQTIRKSYQSSLKMFTWLAAETRNTGY